jgi:hypothetical protein
MAPMGVSVWRSNLRDSCEGGGRGGIWVIMSLTPPLTVRLLRCTMLMHMGRGSGALMIN